tara:strand:- start:132 stop:1100 length:969 start_codon:yes stop_codon:yes gene_type:complete
MFPRKLTKQSKIKRLILKILNVYAYDKETLNIINPNYKNQSNLIDINYKSFNHALGYLELTRKIKKIDIYFRYSPNNNLWNSSDRWKRIVTNVDKKTLISVCLLSLKETILEFLKNNKLNINLNLISDNSNEEFDTKLLNITKSDNIKTNIFKSKIAGNRGSYLECCDQAENAEDLIFFVEDDYLFEKNCLDEMLSSYVRLSSLLKNDLVLCPSDYPFYYDSQYKTSLYVGKNYKWRHVGETLLTFLFSKKILNDHRFNIRKVGNTVNVPFEKPLHEVYKKTTCLAPVNSLSYHLTRSVPDVSDNWKKIWDTNLMNYQNSSF